jgi:heme/copper-type cytochrome/quinol oxidase subunit 3
MTFKVCTQQSFSSQMSHKNHTTLTESVGMSPSFLFQKSVFCSGTESVARHHPYHLVDPSPWPILTSLSALWLALGLVLYFHQYPTAGTFLVLAILCLVYTVSLWWRDVMRESVANCHTDKVKRGLHLGMLLFIVTEAMFFVGLLWAFLHAALMPTVQIGNCWPPLGIVPVNAGSWHDRPILNTWLLLASYFTANMASYSMSTGDSRRCSLFLIVTIVLGAVFSFYQYLEYSDAAFTFSDSIFGSTFYLTTGMHGFHVLIGTLYLLVVLLTLKKASPANSTALSLSILYWHFVDIIWVFVLTLVYVWGGATASSSMELCTDGPCLLYNLLYDAHLDMFSVPKNGSIRH